MKLIIDHLISKQLPFFKVICYQMNVSNRKSFEVEQLIKKTIIDINNKYQYTEILQIPLINSARSAYKILGKDPSHTRVAPEALLRRVLNGKGLYRINDLVDLGNILSLQLCRSVCIVDKDKIIGDIYIRLGNQNDEFKAIGRGNFNVDKIPIYCDSLAPFGSPSSDTERTAITNQTKTIIAMVIYFDNQSVDYGRNLLLKIYQEYANAKNIIMIN